MKKLLVKAIVIGIVFLSLFGKKAVIPVSAQGVPGLPDEVYFSPTTQNVPADGVTPATISVTIKNVSDSSPRVGDTVSLSTSGDATAVFSPTSAILDETGSATFTVTSTTIGTDTITATDTSDTNDLYIMQPGEIVFDSLSETPTLTPTPSDDTTPTPTPTPSDDITPTPTLTPTQLLCRLVPAIIHHLHRQSMSIPLVPILIRLPKLQISIKFQSTRVLLSCISLSHPQTLMDTLFLTV